MSGDNDNTLTINKAVGSITIPTANGVEIKAKFVEQAASFIAGDTIQAFRDNTGENSIFLKRKETTTWASETISFWIRILLLITTG